MKKSIGLIFLLLTLVNSVSAQNQMFFNNGPTEPGFVFTNWAGMGGTIWVSNLAVSATVASNNGSAWDFVSFEVGPFLGANTMQVTSDSGHSYTYSTDTAMVHILNWTGLTTLTFTRIAGSAASADHDNFKYAFNTPCNDPDRPTVRPSATNLCFGDSLSLQIAGNLNDATHWHIYSGGCGVNRVDSTDMGAITLAPPLASTNYYVRGEDGPGCVNEQTVSCDTISVAVTQIDNSVAQMGSVLTANATVAQYQWISCATSTTLPNSTSQQFTPPSSGSYAVVLTDNGCTDTSACVNYFAVGIEDHSFDIASITNPIDDALTIQFNKQQPPLSLNIRDVSGRLLYSQQFASTHRIDLPLDIKSGLYVVELQSPEGAQNFKVLKR